MPTAVLSPLQGTRVLKAHVDAVVNILDTAGIANRFAEDKQAAAKIIAEAVLSATDSKTRCCICVVENGSALYVYGPYATYAAAEKTIAGGHVGTGVEDFKAFVLPLIPAPKTTRGNKK